MSTFNSFVGFRIGGSDIVIISKSVLPNESIRYQIEFEFSTPDVYSMYTWNDDKFHHEFSVLFEHFYNNGSRVTNKNDKWILEGPCITRIENGVYQICTWTENPLEIVENDSSVVEGCEKSPNEVLKEVLMMSVM